MKINTAASLRNAFIGVAVSILSFNQLTAHAESEPDYKSTAEADSKLRQFCSTDNFKTFKGHTECLQETSGQAWKFAESFHASLFVKQGLPADAHYYPNMIAAWTKTISKQRLPHAEQDIVAIKNYAHQCHDILQENIFTPDIALGFSYTTGYNIPKGCIDTAVYFAHKYHVQIDETEAKRLQNHLTSIYSYYKQNPLLPQDEKGKKERKEERENRFFSPFPFRVPSTERTWDI